MRRIYICQVFGLILENRVMPMVAKGAAGAPSQLELPIEPFMVLPMTSQTNDYKPLLLDTRDVAMLLKCSDRHITNLSKEGRIPPPVRLGSLVRWPRETIEYWIAAGCPAVD
jgi:excisionase family DNA binding protein